MELNSALQQHQQHCTIYKPRDLSLSLTYRNLYVLLPSNLLVSKITER